MSIDEVKRLLEAARSRPLVDAKRDKNLTGVTAKQETVLMERGEMRRRIYLTAVKTGLRRGELLRVRWCDVDFAMNRIRIPASSAKSRREQTVEIPADLRLELLAIAPKERKSVTPVFPRKQFPQIRTFLADLKTAGIERKDGDGRVIDFHSLRVTFVTWLVVSGANPKVAQILARHASIETTMQTYTDLKLLDFKGAVAALPDLGDGRGGERVIVEEAVIKTTKRVG